MGRRVGQRIDDLHLLDDRAGPSVRDDDRQRIGLFRTNMDEMNVNSIDRRHELGHRVQPGLELAPVIVRPPVLREPAHRRELNALRRVRHQLLRRPLRRGDPPAQLCQRLAGGMKLKWPQRRVATRLWDRGGAGRQRRRLGVGHHHRKQQSDGPGQRGREEQASVNQRRKDQHELLLSLGKDQRITPDRQAGSIGPWYRPWSFVTGAIRRT